MIIEILSRKPTGTCELTKKQGIEVWAIRAAGGEVREVCTARLPEVLRILTSVGNGQPSTTDTLGQAARTK